jgi:hypothetical protein
LSDVRHQLKAGLYGPDGASLWSIDRRYQAFTRRDKEHFSLQDSLEAELAAIRQAYELTTTPLWASTVDSFANADRVFISGLHMARGLALEFVSRLEYIGPACTGRRAERPLCRRPVRRCPRVAFLLTSIATIRRPSARRIGRRARGPHRRRRLRPWAHKVTDRVFNLPTSTGSTGIRSRPSAPCSTWSTTGSQLAGG